MRDAIGGLVNVQIILVFIVLVSGYLAFSVNYTKAFRVKNKIITAIEQNEGDISAATSDNGDLWNYIRQVGYNPSFSRNTQERIMDELGDGSACNVDLGFCYKENDFSTPTLTKKQYRVVTIISVDIPIIKQIMESINFFKVSGDTKTIIIP